jgi:uncharacterized protein YhfF
MIKSPATDRLWRAYCAARNVTNHNYEIVAFGDSAAMADELSALVLHGPKRATAGLKRDFENGGEPMPVVGEYVVVVDGAGTPVCIWRTTEVTIKPFKEVDAQFAWDEGEGDRTLADWQQGHRDYFTRAGERAGFVFDETMDVVLERFEVVWPVADRAV